MKTYKSISVVILLLFMTSCVQETHLKTFYFKVDMSNVEYINNPGVRGQFTSPAWKELVPLTDNNNDGIYEAKYQCQAAQYNIKFKFVNDGKYELENQPNRAIKFEYKPENFVYEAEFSNPEAKTSKL